MYNVVAKGNQEFLFANREPLFSVTPDSLSKNLAKRGRRLSRENTMDKISGIYEIINTTNGKRYIGSSISISTRLKEHINTLRRQVHHNKHLQSAFNKYEEESFLFRPLLYCDPHMLLIYEQLCISNMHPQYNKSENAERPTLGIKLSEERKAKMREYKPSETTLAKLRISHLGVKASDETRAKMSTSQKGKTMSDVARENMSVAQKGHMVSQEARINMSIAHKGLPSGHKGCKLSDESRSKISSVQKGHKASNETRAKMRASAHRGEDNNKSKLTLVQVDEIRNRYIPRKISQRQLAKEYDVNQQVIWSIVNNKTWRIG